MTLPCIKTLRGSFEQDSLGVWHYRFSGYGIGAEGHIGGALVDALTSSDKPDGVVLFWFNGTSAPIMTNDDADALYLRWSVLREQFQRLSFDIQTRRRPILAHA